MHKRNSKKKVNKILIITKEPFPNGMAATNRIISYAKGFIRNNVDCEVLCFKPTENKYKVNNSKVKGYYQNIPYQYTCGTVYKSSSFIKRRLINLKGIYKAILKLIKEKVENEKIAVINYTPYISHGIIFFLLTRLLNIKYLKEESEHPLIRIKSLKYLKGITNRYYRKRYYKLFDILLLMTTNLIKYFEKYGFDNKRILHVPMTVEYERFAVKKKESNIEDYIAYCGPLNDDKDGVDILIKAFASIIYNFPEIKLYLIGDALNNYYWERYRNMVKEKGVEGKVVFTGRVSREEIPQYLVNAKVLVLPRPNSLQSQHGFPTKLGEYLSTGNPVITTKVGEISDYLTDGMNAYLAEPGNVDSLINKLMVALKNKHKSKQVGINGKKTAIDKFNIITQTKKIIKFIDK